VGVFFINSYDLYVAVKKSPQGLISSLRQAVILATGEDLEQDIKNLCVRISEHEKYDFAFNEVNFLWGLLEEKLSV